MTRADGARYVTLGDMKDAQGETGDGGGAAGSGVPSPSEMLPGLDKDQLRVLGEVGRAWERMPGSPAEQRRALPVDPDLGRFPPKEEIGPDRFGRMVRLASLGSGTATADASPSEGTGRFALRLRHALIGAPLKSTAVTRERMRKLVALPVLSADALSSVAYGPEALLAVLVLAGTAGLSYTAPIAGAIAFLMLAVGLSYRQTIRAYPHGGGSYIVASD
ncbi:amino acid permease, partial [Streptomyces sp. AcH 505]